MTATADPPPAPADEGPPEGGPLQGQVTRLHPSAIAVWTLEAIYALVLIVVTGGAVPTLGAAILVAVLGANTLRYLRFRWKLDSDSLVIERGLLRRHRRVIPRDRVQTVDLEVRLRHRLFGVVEVRVEALGGNTTEGKLAALDPETAEKLRHTLMSGGDTPQESEDRDADLLASAGPGRLVAAGLTGGRVGVGAAIVGFLLQFVPEERLARWVADTNGEVPEVAALGGLELLLVVVVVALVSGFVLSLVATVLTYWDFTLERDGDTLRVRRGLLTLHRDTVPFRRIQAVQVEENLARRVLKCAAVRVIVAGRAGARGEDDTNLILPLGRRTEAFQLAGRVSGHVIHRPPELRSMPSGARERRLIRAALVTVAGTAAVALALWVTGNPPPSWGPGLTLTRTAVGSAVVLAAVSVTLAFDAYRNLGWQAEPGHVIVREGVLTRVTTLVPVDRLQAVETSTNPFQRRRGLTTLHLPIAQPLRAGRAPRALDLEGVEAAFLLTLLASRIRELPPRIGGT